MRRTKPEAARHFVLKGFDIRRKELDDRPALGAYHVVVMLVVVMVLVIRLVVAKTDFPRKAGLGQELQGAIDGRQPDRRVFSLHE